MHALLWAAGGPPTATGRGLGHELLRQVLGLERAHWRRLAAPEGAALQHELDRAVAQLTLVGGVPDAAAAQALLKADPLHQAGHGASAAVEPLLHVLTRGLGRADGSLAGLEPAPLGEAQVAEVADVELLQACLAWAGPGAAGQRARRELLRVLQNAGRAEQGPQRALRVGALLDHLAAHRLQALAEDMVPVMSSQPGALAECVAQHLDGYDFQTLQLLNRLLPTASLSLVGLALQVGLRCADLADERFRAVQARRSATAEERDTAAAQLAESQDLLSARFARVGMHERAQRASERALQLVRELEQRHPGDWTAALARSLRHHGRHLLDTGRGDEALAAVQEAVALYTRLAAAQPEAHAGGLAQALGGLADVLFALRRLGEAEQATRRALDVLAPWAEGAPSRHAAALRTLQHDLQRYEQDAAQAA